MIGCMILAISGAPSTAAEIEAERVIFLCDNRALQGCIYKPKGKGPFPAVIYNQGVVRPLGSSGPLNPFPELAKFYLDRGYVLFVPGRHPHADKEKEEKPSQKPPADDTGEDSKITDITGIKLVENYEPHNEDVIAAVEWLKAQIYVDEKRIVMSGFAAGGISTLFVAEQDLGIRGYIVFSPGAGLWDGNQQFQAVMRRFVKNATAPIFLIQPQNDRSLGPIKVLGKDLEKKGSPNRSKIYPPFGSKPGELPVFANQSCDIWGNDVAVFLKEVME